VTYDLDGKLFYAGRMHDEFDPKSISLKPVHVETVEGQIYVCLADRRPDFALQLRPRASSLVWRTTAEPANVARSDHERA